jgi:3-oxoacyl-[acyl-carrier protein] reductase
VPGKLDGQAAIVTGGARGIGERYARALAAQGAAVVIADLDEATAEAVAAGIVEEGGRAIAVRTDVSDEASVGRMVARSVQAFQRIDILVNNAAIFADDVAGFAVLSWDPLTGSMEHWRRLQAVNVDGVLICSRAVAPVMQSQGAGRIVNQSSTGAYMDQGGAYGLTKLGVCALTRMLAARLGPSGVTVNAIAPGLTITDAVMKRPGREDGVAQQHAAAIAAQVPLRRVATPDDLVGALLFLAGPDSAYVSGQTLQVDGGWVRRI